ncbi:MAG: GNAT family N-acetyltransferase [Eubacteriales bacterium]
MKRRGKTDIKRNTNCRKIFGIVACGHSDSGRTELGCAFSVLAAAQPVSAFKFLEKKGNRAEGIRMMMNEITIRPEEHRDYKSIVSLILRSFREGTDYSDGTDIIALVEEIRDSSFYIPELSFVAETDNRIVGHFMFSEFPLSPAREGGHNGVTDSGIVMLAPVSVHADYFRRGIGTAMLRLGIDKVRKSGYKGITVEGNYKFYNRIGFRTSSEFNIYPTSGYPMEEPRCMMCQETYDGALEGIHGYIVYDMYCNA